MKKLILFLIFWSVPAQALFVQEDVVRTEHRFWVEGTSDQLSVEVHQTFENTSRRVRSVTLWEPLSPSASEVKLFVNAQGWPMDVFEGEEARERMFYQAKEQNDERFFRLVTPPFGRVLRSMEIPIPPKSSIKVKLQYLLQPDFADGVFFSEFFVDDTLDTSAFEFAFRVGSSREISHFLTNLPEEGAFTESSEEEVLYLFRGNHTPVTAQNVRVFWSELEEPVFRFPTRQGTFVGRFGELPEQKEHKEVLFLIDRSGSMLGRPWERTEDWLHYLLEQLPTGAQVQIGFFGGGAEFFEEEAGFVPNSFSFQKKFFEYFDAINPVGKTDFMEALEKTSEKWSADFEDRLLVLIGDVGDVQVEVSALGAPTVLLDFSSQVTPFQDIVRLGGGFVVPLFQSPLRLVEQPLFERFWKHWWQTSFGGQALFAADEQEVEPNQFENAFQFQSPLYVGRSLGGGAGRIEALDFLPSLWAARRIAHLLESESPDIDALLALGRTFGVKTSLFNDRTSRDQLEQALDKPMNDVAWSQEYQHLVHPTDLSATTSVRRVQGVPLYYEESEKVWRSYDFFEKARADTLIVVSPYSDALKQLYLQFPESFTKLLGVGERVDFCFKFRCVSIRPSGRDYPVQKDALFWHFAPPRDHWAYEAVQRLIEKGALLFPSNGDLQLDKPISRAGFLEILGRSSFGADYKWTGDLNQFTDIDSTHPFAKAVGFFSSKGIIRGYGPENGPWEFRPGQSLTRAEAVKILLLTKGLEPAEIVEGENPVFADTDDWSRVWAETAFAKRLAKGYDEDGVRLFKPHAPLTRAEAFVLMGR